jgi:hypothetical protein
MGIFRGETSIIDAVMCGTRPCVKVEDQIDEGIRENQRISIDEIASDMHRRCNDGIMPN